MRVYIFCLCLMGLSVISNYAQTSEPGATAGERQQQAQANQEARRAAQEQMIRQQRMDEQERRLRALSDNRDSGRTYVMGAVGWAGYQSKSPLYRKTTKEELRSIAPDQQDFTRFADFLRQENTGLIKLVPDKGCYDNPNIVNVSSDCLAYTMPGGGSSFSFRVKDYRIQRLADINFYNNSFQATGILLHGIFTAIGDVPLEKVNLQTKGIDFLNNFTPVTDIEQAKLLDEKLVKGIESNGFLYRRAVAAKDNTTYLLRSIAFRGTLWRAVSGLTYNEFDLDKRNDIIIAFRVVRRYDDGAVLILWKRLAKKDSPKLKWKNGGRNNQIKSSDFTAAIK